MARGALTTILSVGLSAGVVVFSFFGCYTDLGEDKGKCQAATDPDPGGCTILSCKSDGTPDPKPVPDEDKRVCFRGKNEGICVKGDCALTCETQGTACKCESDAACPSDKQCVDWACDPMGECKSTLKPDDMVVDTLEMKDCKKVVCKGGLSQTVADDTDKPDDILKDCKQPACLGDVPGTQPNATDKPDDIPKDCKAPVCVGDMPDTEPNDTDKPDPTGCTSYQCGDGMILPTDSPLNSACMMVGGMAGVCDGKGTCKLADGKACQNAMECASGNCADGVCCNTTCTDECKSCNQAGKAGMCTNIPYYQPDPSYEVNGSPRKCEPMTNSAVCDGMGKCLKTVLAACTLGTQCISGVCATITMGLQCKGAKSEACFDKSECVSNTCNAMGACE